MQRALSVGVDDFKFEAIFPDLFELDDGFVLCLSDLNRAKTLWPKGKPLSFFRVANSPRLFKA